MTPCPNCGTQYQEIVDCANHLRNAHHYSPEECSLFISAKLTKSEESNNCEHK